MASFKQLCRGCANNAPVRRVVRAVWVHGTRECSASTQRESEHKRDDVVCPFCNESGFDLVGLKSHLEHGDCDRYNSVEVVKRLSDLGGF